MEHSHSHNHNHDHSRTLTNVNTAFIIGITFNFLFVVIEVIAGLIIHSLSLLSDAGHNLADVGALALSLLAYRLLKVKSNQKFTYGYRKTSVIVALFNAMVLLISIGAITYEAVLRFLNPEPVQGKVVAIIAGIGIVINSLTAIMFLKDKDNDINIKTAYLHLMSDAVVSVGIVIAGIIIYYTQWFWVDSVVSIIIALVILAGTWRLLKESLKLSLDGVPAEIDMENLKKDVMNVKGVQDFHHIHVWAISTTENALTAHLVLSKEISTVKEQEIKSEIKHLLLHKKIHHITIETERENEKCAEVIC